MKKFNVLYNGRKIYQDLSYEECVECLDEIAESYYSTEETFDPTLLELEEI
jgi:hypothetical protein